MSLNLHSIVRNAISAVNANEKVLLIHSLGNTNTLGKIVAVYSDAVLAEAQIQPIGGDDLAQIDESLRTEKDRKFYLMADKSPVTMGQNRILARTGDFIYRLSDATVWRIFSLSEDYSPAGWVLVFASQQENTEKAVQAVIDAYNSAQEEPEETDPEEDTESGTEGEGGTDNTDASESTETPSDVS